MLDFLFIALIIIGIYFFLVFFVSRLIVPHLGFNEEKIPDKVPADMLKTIEELKSRANTKREFLTLAFEYLGSRYRSERLNTFLKPPYLFYPLEKIWELSGYIPCTQSNFLLTIFLIKSGFFQTNEIRRKHVFVNFVVHQYLQVKIENAWIDVDVGEIQRGMPLGKHLKYFG